MNEVILVDVEIEQSYEIAICYINSGGYRLVTYADSLNANGAIAKYNYHM